MLPIDWKTQKQPSDNRISSREPRAESREPRAESSGLTTRNSLCISCASPVDNKAANFIAAFACQDASAKSLTIKRLRNCSQTLFRSPFIREIRGYEFPQLHQKY